MTQVMQMHPRHPEALGQTAEVEGQASRMDRGAVPVVEHDAPRLWERFTPPRTDGESASRLLSTMLPQDLHNERMERDGTRPPVDLWLPETDQRAIADAAGGDWPALARAGAAELHSGDLENESYGVLLLADIRDVVEPDEPISTFKLASRWRSS
ncbi:MAG: DUF3631 domain-containing protein [Actinomycetota bacterium]